MIVLAAGMAAPHAAWATNGHGHAQAPGATDGSGAPLGRDETAQAGSRGDELAGDDDRRGDGTGVSVVAPVVEPAAEPQLTIADAVGPISGTDAVTRAPEAGSSALTGARTVPVLSFDAPNPFGPTSLAGRLRDAPEGVVVQVAIRRGSSARGCAWWNARAGRFTASRRSACTTPRWMTASLRATTGGLRWRAVLGGALPAGTQRYAVRVLDAGGRPILFVRI